MASCQSSAGIGKARRQDRWSNHYATPPTTNPNSNPNCNLSQLVG